MKKSLTLSIPQPCTEKWNSFTPATAGGFCPSCSKVVIDFTKMNDREIMEFFGQKQTPTCGRFHPHQLKTYADAAPLQINPGFTLLKVGVISLLVAITSKPISAQNAPSMTKTEIVPPAPLQSEETFQVKEQIIKGIILSDEDKAPLARVNIFLKGTTSVGIVSDVYGRFEFPQKLEEGDVLIFSSIGLEGLQYTIPKTAPETIEILMKFSYLEMMGEIAVVDQIDTRKQSIIRVWWSKMKSWF